MRAQFRSAFAVPSGFCVATPAAESARPDVPAQTRPVGASRTPDATSPATKKSAKAA